MPDTKLKPDTVLRRRRQIGEKMQKLQQELKDLKKRCSHDGHVVYCPDPSGNNDSGYECIACGSEWRRWPEGVSR
jgi:hypothetical protein